METGWKPEKAFSEAEIPPHSFRLRTPRRIVFKTVATPLAFDVVSMGKYERFAKLSTTSVLPKVGVF
jgi:hypothetical protein